MSNFKVVTVVGTRPEIIKLSRVIALLDSHTEHTLIHTGQNYDYELNEIFFKELNVRKPDFFLDAAGENPSQTIGEVIKRVDPLLEKIEPNAMLIYGDTNSCLSVIPAKRRKIPIFHMEAGNRSFDQRVPEEINRKIVDHLSDINLPLSEHARKYLENEGIRPETVIKIGSPMKEVLNHHADQIDSSKILESLKISEDSYFIVSIHREENVDNPTNFNDLLNSLDYIANKFALPVLVSTHPRTRKKLESIGYSFNSKLIQFLKPFGFFDYIKLQKNAKCVISDSGTVSEESSLLGLKSITIRQAHERPEASDVGTFIMTGLKKESIEQAINFVTSNEYMQASPINDYETTDVSQKVLKTIFSYTDYVNRVVWKKY